MARFATAAPVVPRAALEEGGSIEEEEVPVSAPKKRCLSSEAAGGDACAAASEEEGEPAPASKKPCHGSAAADDAGEAASAEAAEAAPEEAAEAEDAPGAEPAEVAGEAAGADDVSSAAALSAPPVAASMAPADGEEKAGPLIWEFEVKDGFEPFPGDCQGDIEEQYKKGTKVGKVVSKGRKIVLEFGAMKQYVEGSEGRKRRLRRSRLAVVWKFKITGGFKAFELSQQAKVEKAYQRFLKDGPSTVEVAVGRKRSSVKLDFDAMKQEGSSTGRARDLSRVVF